MNIGQLIIAAVFVTLKHCFNHCHPNFLSLALRLNIVGAICAQFHFVTYPSYLVKQEGTRPVNLIPVQLSTRESTLSLLTMI